MPKKIPSQKILKESIDNIPIEFFIWGTPANHYKIEMPHRHDFTELLFFTKGGGYHEIDFISHEIFSNSIHLIPASSIHFLDRSKDSDGFTIAFDTQFLGTNPIHRMVYPLGAEAVIINLCQEKFEFILTITNILKAQIEEQETYFKEKAFLLSMELLFTTIAKEIQGEFFRSNLDADSIVTKFKADVRKNVHNNYSVKNYADRLHITAKYLSEHLRVKTGKTAKQWILEILLISIKKQLINSDLSIKEIAFHHNFNESSLSKLFKKNVGFTMTAYRKNKNTPF